MTGALIAIAFLALMLVIYWLTEPSKKTRIVDVEPKLSGVVRLEPPKVIGTVPEGVGRSYTPPEVLALVDPYVVKEEMLKKDAERQESLPFVPEVSPSYDSFRDDSPASEPVRDSHSSDHSHGGD